MIALTIGVARVIHVIRKLMRFFVFIRRCLVYFFRSHGKPIRLSISRFPENIVCGAMMVLQLFGCLLRLFWIALNVVQWVDLGCKLGQIFGLPVRFFVKPWLCLCVEGFPRCHTYSNILSYKFYFKLFYNLYDNTETKY